MYHKDRLKNKDIDLLLACRQIKEPSKYASLIKYAAFPTVASIMICSVFGYKTYSNYRLNNDIKTTYAEADKIQKQIDTDPNKEKYDAFLRTRDETMKYERIYKNIQSYPQLSQRTFDSILLASSWKVNVVSFAYVRQSQIISLQIEASTANETELFVRRLKSIGIFEDVKYAGYTKIEKATQTPELTEDKKDSNLSMQEALLQALLDGDKEIVNQQPIETDKVTMYTATILCTLKK